jgi:Zn-dependent protease with chaperone function
MPHGHLIQLGDFTMIRCADGHTPTYEDVHIGMIDTGAIIADVQAEGWLPPDTSMIAAGPNLAMNAGIGYEGIGDTEQLTIAIDPGIAGCLSSDQLRPVMLHEAGHHNLGHLHNDIGLTAATQAFLITATVGLVGAIVVGRRGIQRLQRWMRNRKSYLSGYEPAPQRAPVLKTLFFAWNAGALMTYYGAEQSMHDREFAADRFAADAMGTGIPLADALRETENIVAANNLNADPVYRCTSRIMTTFGSAPADKLIAATLWSSPAGILAATCLSSHPRTDDRIAALIAYTPQLITPPYRTSGASGSVDAGQPVTATTGPNPN